MVAAPKFPGRQLIMLFTRLKETISRHWPQQWHPYHLARRKIHRAARAGVISGPFKGLRYVERSLGSAYEPKLLGIYELELHTIIEALCRQNFPVMIDVGAAEGYYAVGMTWRHPATRMLAYEAEAEGRVLIARLAELNKVESFLDIRGYCSSAELRQQIQRYSSGLLMMDVEGGEEDLLDTETASYLATWTVLVETHDYLRAGISARLKSRFAGTHQIQEIPTRERRLEDLPLRSLWLDRWLLKFTREFRPGPQLWLFLKPG